MDPEQRRSFENLVLFCATHGREVDDPKAGARLFPRKALESMKRAHEAKFSALVDRMIDSATALGPIITDMADIGARSSLSPRSGQRFLQWLEIDEEHESAAALAELEACRQTLAALSQPALECLALLLRMWESSVRTDRHGGPNFQDPASVHYAALTNRISDREGFFDLLMELHRKRLLTFPDLEVAPEYQEYILHTPWTEYRSWATFAWFLLELDAGPLSEWLPTLDFSVFD